MNRIALSLVNVLRFAPRLYLVKAVAALSFVLLSALCSQTLLAQTSATAKNSKAILAPSLYLGKTFEQCEKILGKPKFTEDLPEERLRYYKVPVPGLTRIVLSYSPDRRDGPISKTVHSVIFHFPKGTKTWEEALAFVGLNAQGVKEFPAQGVKSRFLDPPDGEYQAIWVQEDGKDDWLNVFLRRK